MSPFKVKSVKDLGIYYVYKVNSHMAGANPFIQFTMWSHDEQCWVMDDAKNYIPEPGWKELDRMIAETPDPKVDAMMEKLDKGEDIFEDEKVPVIDTKTGEKVGDIKMAHFNRDDLHDIQKAIAEAGEPEKCCGSCCHYDPVACYCSKRDDAVMSQYPACDKYAII